MNVGIRRKLLLALTIAVACGLIVTIAAVLRSAHGKIESGAQGELVVASRVFDQLLADRNDQLAGHASLLAEDLRFKQAIAKHAITRSDRDIIALLQAHQKSIDADLSLLVDSRGRITANAPPKFFSPAVLHRLRSNEVNQLNASMVVNGKPYQLVFSPIMARNWIAWVGMGFELDGDLLERLKEVTGMQATLLYQRQNEAVQVISTLPDSLANLVRTEGLHLPGSAAAFVQDLDEHNWLTTPYPILQSPESNILLLVSTSVADEYLAYESLRGQLLMVAMLIAFLTAGIALWYSGKANHAIHVMSLAAQRITRGDYSKDLALANSHDLVPLEEAFNKMQRAVQEREDRFSFQARHDQLTGVPNRNHFEFWLKSRLDNTHPPRPCALVLEQICGLAQLGDVYGQAVADELVRETAQRSSELLGERDKIARFDSDQFLMYFEGKTGDELAALEDRITSVYASPFAIAGNEIRLEIRFGLVLCPLHGTDYADLLRRANIALSQTFVNRTTLETYRSGQDALHLRKLQIIHLLQSAIDKNQFELLLQPQLDVGSRTVVRAEALLRWHEPSLGQVQPDEFIPLAERAGYIPVITRWIVEQATAQLSRWKEKKIDVGISINISAQDLVKTSLVEHLAKCIQRAGVPSSKLVLEVTETAMMEHPLKVIKNLRRIHKLGVTIAMDDFGTGFSSLSQLKSLPIHELKIDKTFILNLDKDNDDQKIVRAAIEMAHNLSLEVVAEGVENLPSLAMLESMGCDVVQGNQIGKPMSVADFENWLSTVDLQSFIVASESRATDQSSAS
ncbi:EAL domain-containing protein [Proteobacteria bacterium 005FR1]|nr:EAL domain-containing protein [Proteobacteria bacterium 005FR1]